MENIPMLHAEKSKITYVDTLPLIRWNITPPFLTVGCA